MPPKKKATAKPSKKADAKALATKKRLKELSTRREELENEREMVKRAIGSHGAGQVEWEWLGKIDHELDEIKREEWKLHGYDLDKYKSGP